MGWWRMKKRLRRALRKGDKLAANNIDHFLDDFV